MIRKYLSQRFPYEENKWKIILPVSLFVGLFMLVFQPFGLSELEMEFKTLVLTGFGVVTLIVLIFNLIFIPSLFPKAFNEESWIVWKELLFLLWILFTVGLGNLLYSSYTMGFNLSLSNVIIFQTFTVAVGIIPVTVLVLLKQNYLRRKNEGDARILNTSLERHLHKDAGDPKVTLVSENEKDNISLSIDDLLYVKSDGNYITVGYLKDSQHGKVMLRQTMKYATGRLAAYPQIFQCHRSWLVNLDRIDRVTGNSQGLRLIMEGFDADIPVARNQSPEVRRRITMERDL